MFEPPQSLVEAVRNRTLVPFVGAGVSVGAVHGLAPELRFPDWNGLIAKLADRLAAEGRGKEAAEVRATLPDTMKAAQLAMDQLGRPRFLDEMERAFGRFRSPPGANLSAVQAIWRLQSPFVITTNYDRVLAWPWDPSQIQAVHNDDPSLLAKLGDTSYSKLRIWHIHGSIDRVDTLILTSEQYRDLYPDGDATRTRYQNAFDHFKELLKTRSFLFVGFSLHEPVLRRKLEDALRDTVRAMPIKFLLLREGEADDTSKQRFFDDYHVQVIEFAEFGEPMIAAIDAIGRAAWPNAISVQGAGLTKEMEPLVEDLLQAVEGLIVPPGTIAQLYNASKPQAWEPKPTGGDAVALLRHAIVQLATAISPAPGAVPPLLDFVNRLRGETTEPWLTRLTHWLRFAVARLAADAAAGDRMKQLLAKASETAAGERVQVLVRIRNDTASTGTWRVHAWSWSGTLVPESLFGAEGNVYKEGSSGEVIYDLFDQLEARRVDPELTSIAFIVPGPLACEPIHSWRLPESIAADPPIGATYTVTVRPLERLERAPLIRRRFKRAWDELKKRAADVLAVLDPSAAPPAAGVPAVLLDASAAMRRDLALELEKRGACCVVLREPPSADSFDQLRAVLDTTTPAIVWSREASTSPAESEKAIRDLLQSVPIADIPRRIRDERLAAFRDGTGTHRGMHLTLIWDDADYVPPEHDPTARARLETI